MILSLKVAGEAKIAGVSKRQRLGGFYIQYPSINFLGGTLY